MTPKLSRTYAVVVVVTLFLASCERTAPTEPAPGAEHGQFTDTLKKAVLAEAFKTDQLIDDQ